MCQQDTSSEVDPQNDTREGKGIQKVTSTKSNHCERRTVRPFQITKLRFRPDLLSTSLQLLLFEAERAWAYAQELINASLQPSNKERASTLRHSATGRFRRAVNWSTRLLSLCQTLYASSRISAENLIEVTVYSIILNGRFLRYRDDFEDGLIQLSVARGLLDNLADAAPTSRDRALATLFSDEIGPEIRYCAHELGHARAYDINGIVAELFSKYKNQIVESCEFLVEKLNSEQKASSKSNLRERVWEGQPVPVRYPELVDAFVKVEAAELALEKFEIKKSKTGVTAYDAVLASLSDAEEVARKLLESQQVNRLLPFVMARF